ncbi:ribonuclease D [Sphingomonas rhizophila]|uniref:Ribonuclease D n=1 Tax=Sphingomonas rhizophila TaxID=2071607 RepID=A0A7G9SDN1_9SPHN|nr:ribonuclease D [Sphingomonas rhizophila]QNN65956.1 ribonuclease D [Sphingomonas rhizophila]
MKIHKLITKSDELKSLVERLSTHDFVAVDTEFMRENTYWPELCLLQIASVEEAAAIDPLADGLDMQPLLDLLVDNDEVLKVFHAGGQDLEIVHNLTGKLPVPLFDTQVAAMALGYGEQIGYSNLVESMLGHSLDKGARFTDWSRRPLDKRQIDYAIADVTHLATIFPKMVAKLRKTGRGDWLDDEMERLADPSSFAFAPEDAWKRLKLPTRNPAVLGRLKALAAWRESEARGKNLPRGRIVKDDTLAELASHPPKTQDDLGKVRGLSAGWRGNDIGARLMSALGTAEPLGVDDLPSREPRRPGLTKDGALVSDLLKLLLKIRAKEVGVASKLIARTDEIEALAAGVRSDLGILSGWRFEQFGRDALALVEGQLAFAIENGKLKMTRAAASVEPEPAPQD